MKKKNKKKMGRRIATYKTESYGTKYRIQIALENEFIIYPSVNQLEYIHCIKLPIQFFFFVF